MKTLKLFAFIFIIFCIKVSDIYSQQTLFIEVIENEESLRIIASLNSQSKSFIINNPKKFLLSCNKIDDIVSRTDEGNSSILLKLNNEIDFLSNELFIPIMSLIKTCDLINIKISKVSIRIPFEFLKFDNDLIYRQKPIIFSFKKINLDNTPKLTLQNGFIVTDLTADPENACRIISKNFKSEFHYIENVNINTIENANNLDFILMSVHGNIDINSCEGYISINHEKLYPNNFSQRNLKLIYFDSCHLGKGQNFVDRFQSLDAEYFLGPIISNEAGNSSTKTILTFFKRLENYNPIESLFKTKQELQAYSNDNILTELWFAAGFRLYKLN